MLDMSSETAKAPSTASYQCSEDVITCAHHMMNACHDVAIQTWRKPLSVQKRAMKEPVTQVDYALETLMISILRERRPHDSVISDLTEVSINTQGYRWVLRPLDNTPAFIAGRTDFSMMLACLHDDSFVLGMIEKPISRDRWVGAKGFATTHNDARTHLRKEVRLHEAIIACSLQGRADLALREHASMLLPAHGDAFGLVASGLKDALIFDHATLNDFAAGVAIIHGVGGAVTDWQGQPVSSDYEGPILASVCDHLHQQLIQRLS